MGGWTPLTRQIDLYTAQAVRLSYRIADLGSRAAALLLDLLIQGAAALVLTLLISAATPSIGGYMVEALLIAVNFAIFFGYYVVLEAIGGGQTLGKRALGIRVVGADGSHCGWGRSVLRNLLRVVDWMPFLYGVGIIMVATTREHRRLGDFVGGTVVVHVERAGNDEFAATGARPDPLGRLRAQDIEARLPELEGAMLRSQELMRRRETLLKDALARIAKGIRSEFEAVLGPQDATDDVRFLEHVMYLHQEISLPPDALLAAGALPLTGEEKRQVRACAVGSGRRAQAERVRILKSFRSRGWLESFDDTTAWQALAHTALRPDRPEAGD